MSQRALGAQFKALGMSTREMPAIADPAASGGRHQHFTPATGNEVWDEGSYMAGGKKDGGVWSWLDGAVDNEYHRLKPFSEN